MRVLALLLMAVCSQAAVIVSQAPAPNGDVVSQVFPDVPDFTAYSSDDFTLSGAYTLTALTIFGNETGDSTANTAVTAEIWDATPGSVGANLLFSFAGTQSGSDLNFVLPGTPLGPGTYWLTAYVTRPFSGGQWFWLHSNIGSPSGSEAYVYNPGGGFGVGTDPVPVRSLVGGDPVDLAFELQGDLAGAPVPEPSTYALMGSALAGLALLRRRR